MLSAAGVVLLLLFSLMNWIHADLAVSPALQPLPLYSSIPYYVSDVQGSYVLIDIFANRTLFDYCDVSLVNYSPENGRQLLRQHYHTSHGEINNTTNIEKQQWVGFLGRYTGSDAEDIVSACGPSMSPLSAKLLSPGQTVLDISLAAYLQNLGMRGSIDWSSFSGATWYKYQNIKGVKKGPSAVIINQDIGDVALGSEGVTLHIFTAYLTSADGDTINQLLSRPSSSSTPPLLITINNFTENPLDTAAGPASAFNVLFYLTYLVNVVVLVFSCIVVRKIVVSLNRRMMTMDYKYATSLCCLLASLMKTPLLNPYGFNNALSLEPVSIVLTHQFLYLALSLIGNIFSFCFLMDYFRTVEDAMSFKIVSRKFRRTSMAIALMTGVAFVAYVGYSWGRNFNRVVRASYEYNYHCALLSIVLGLLLVGLIGRVFKTIQKVMGRVSGKGTTTTGNGALTTAAKTLHDAAIISRTVSLTDRNHAVAAQHVPSSTGTATSTTVYAMNKGKQTHHIGNPIGSGVLRAGNRDDINENSKNARQDLYVKVITRMVHSCQYMMLIAILLIVNGVFNIYKYNNQDCDGYIALIVIQLGIPLTSSAISLCDLLIVYKGCSGTDSE